MKTNILNVKVDCLSFQETLTECKNYLEKNDKARMIFTPNPEVIMKANESKEFLKILNSADLVVPDGIGVVLASKLNKTKIKERVTGYDLSFAILHYMEAAGKSGYFFGSGPAVAKRAVEKLKTKFPHLKIIGYHDGVNFKEHSEEVVAEINEKKPDVVFVGLGMVNQESWIYENAGRLNTKLLIGFGGCLDHFAGDVKRAPLFYQKLGLEWLYRRITLKRKGRQKALFLFVKEVLKSKYSK